MERAPHATDLSVFKRMLRNYCNIEQTQNNKVKKQLAYYMRWTVQCKSSNVKTMTDTTGPMALKKIKRL